VPNPYNSQDYDRYAYARNNPINYTDPSGHKVCTDDGYCGNISGTSYQKYIYSNAIKDVYDWNLEGNWTLKELKTIYQTGRDIEAYADIQTGGNGLAWMNEYLGNLTIWHWNKSHHMTLPWIGGGGKHLMYISTQLTLDSGWFAHELGHVWDFNTSGNIPLVDGVGDQLNHFIGGNGNTVFNARWINDSGMWFDNGKPSKFIPQNSNDYIFKNHFDGTNFFHGEYGNNATADYLADSFAGNIYDSNNVPVPAQAFINIMIAMQANNMP